MYNKFQAYGAGRFFYSSTTGTYDNSGGGTSSKVDAEPYKVFGIDKSLGCRWQATPKLAYFGEHYSQFGWGSGKDGPVKINETEKYGCYRGGVSIGF